MPLTSISGTLWECDDGSLPLDGPLRKWNKLMVDAADASGRPMTINRSLYGWAKDAGKLPSHSSALLATWALFRRLNTGVNTTF